MPENKFRLLETEVPFYKNLKISKVIYGLQVCHSGLLARRHFGGAGIYLRLQRDSRQAGMTNIGTEFGMDKSIIKSKVEDLLRKRDLHGLLELCEKNRHYWQEVRFRLYDLDERLRWPAIETVAKLMKKWWDSGKEEKVRIYIRTLFWSMSDESGGIGWSSPQTVAEIIATNPELIDPYGSMMIAHCVDEPPLLKGCLWGIGRMGSSITVSVRFFQDRILKVFQDDDVEILALAAWAMAEAGFDSAAPSLEKLRFRGEPVKIYIDGIFYEKPLGEWIEEALIKMKKVG